MLLPACGACPWRRQPDCELPDAGAAFRQATGTAHGLLQLPTLMLISRWLGSVATGFAAQPDSLPLSALRSLLALGLFECCRAGSPLWTTMVTPKLRNLS